MALNARGLGGAAALVAVAEVLVAVTAAAQSPPSGARTSTFVPGQTWASFPKDSYNPPAPLSDARSCMAGCIRDGNCRAWLFYGPPYAAQCFFFRTPQTQMRATRGLFVGVIRLAAIPPAANVPTPAAAAPLRTSTFVPNRWWASSYASGTIYSGPANATAQACRLACIRDAKCKAWNFYTATPGSTATTGSCNLLTAVPPKSDQRASAALGVIQLKAPASPTPPPGIAGPPADPRQAYRAGLEANRRGDNKTAVEYLTAAIASGRLDPTTRVSAIWVRGSSLFNLKRYAEARTDYDVVVQAKPNEADPYRGRAMILRELGQLEAARADADKAVALAPKNAANHAERGHVRAAAGDNAGALEDYAQALALRTDDREVLARRVQTYRRLGRFQDALADATRRVALAPNDAAVLRERGELLRDLARYDEAAADFARAVQLKPDDSGILWARALLELHRGNPAAAVADLGKYAQAHPVYAYGPILHFLAQQRTGQRGFATLARAAIRLELAKWPAPVIHFLLGNMTAPDLLAAAKSEKPETERDQMCEAEFYLGQAALAGGNKAEAQARLTRARELCPPNFIESPWAAADLKRLEAAR